MPNHIGHGEYGEVEGESDTGKLMPNDGKAAASTALPQPGNVSPREGSCPLRFSAREVAVACRANPFSGEQSVILRE